METINSMPQPEFTPPVSPEVLPLNGGSTVTVTPPPLYQPPQPLPHDSAFAWLSPLLGFLFVRYVAVYADGFAATGFFWLLFCCCAAYVRKYGCRVLPSHWVLGGIICAFSTVFSLTASALLHGLCFVFLMTAQIWWVQAVCSGTRFVTRWLPFDLSGAVLSKPMQYMGIAPRAISASVRKSETAKTVRTVLLGLLVTVPLTAVVAGLLANADSGVERILRAAAQLLTNNVLAIIMQILFGIPVGFWLMGMLHAGAQNQKTPLPADAVYEEQLAGLRFLPNLGLYAGVTPICLLYLLYVISQTNYFLSAFAGRLPGDMIYSEYARRGFFELCAIAVINLLVILVLTGCAKQGGAQRPKALTFYACLLSGFTLFIIATALAKMVLYIDAYGLTRLRLYTAWFMTLLAVVFLVLLVRQFVRRFPTAAVLSAVFIVLFGGLCFARPDALIAEYNITRYEQGTLHELDVQMLCGLSDDAYVVMAEHADTLAEAGARSYFLAHAEDRLEAYAYGSPGQSWNISAQRLKAFLEQA